MILPGWSRLGSLLGVDLVTIVIVIVSARVVPMFTRNATRVEGIENIPVLDRAAIAAMVVVVATDVLTPGSALAGAITLLAGVLVAARAWRWGARHTLRTPLLWILHLGHAWLAIGLVLRGVSVFSEAVPSSMGLHALTAGAIGALTLGMMARVSLGHTGRMLAAPKPVAVAFGVITVATVLRVVAPLSGTSQNLAARHRGQSVGAVLRSVPRELRPHAALTARGRAPWMKGTAPWHWQLQFSSWFPQQ